jgi:glycosyltransferase involved in cell wall biosynthesis
MRLVVVTSVCHYRFDGVFWAYGPYVLEIEMWADLFSCLILAAPCREEKPPGDCLPIRRTNIEISRKLEAGGPGLRGKMSYLWKLPILTWQLMGDLVSADCVHVRSPSNLGCLASLLAPLFTRRMVCKYAAQWVPYPGEPLMFRLQRAILASGWWRGPVTVYGEWFGQPAQVIPFFSSAMSESQLAKARESSAAKRFQGPLRVLYVGRLSRPKNVHVLLHAVAQANKQDANLTCSIVGTGPELPRLKQLAEELNISNCVEFTGGIDHEGVLDQLHMAQLLVLVSESEGWPKALCEAMAYGLLCIGSNRGLVPQLLGEGRGFVIEAGDSQALADVLSNIAANPARYEPMSRAATAWAQEFSLERLRNELRSLLEKSWGCRLSDDAPPRGAEPDKQAVAQRPI